jgi:hypothetical protein
MADYHRQHRGGRKAFKLLSAGAVEIRPHQQVFRRIAAERQFGGQQHVRAAVAGADGEAENPVHVAGKVAHRGIHLGDCDAQAFHGADYSRSGQKKARRKAGMAPGKG